MAWPQGIFALISSEKLSDPSLKCLDSIRKITHTARDSGIRYISIRKPFQTSWHGFRSNTGNRNLLKDPLTRPVCGLELEDFYATVSAPWRLRPGSSFRGKAD